MTKEQKEERVIQWLTEHHLFVHGGYPHDWTAYAGRLFVADLDDGKERHRTMIVAYEESSLAPWYDAASRYMKAYDYDCTWPKHTGFGDWSEAFLETAPGELPR